MDPSAAELYDAIKAYASRTVASVRATGVALSPEPYPGWRWVEDDHYAFHPMRDTVLNLRAELESHHASDEYRRCLALLHQHPVIGPRLGKLVGTHLSQTLLDAEGIPDRPVWRLLRTDAQLSDVFDGIFWEQYEWLIREEEVYVLIAPVSGLACDKVPIKLDPDLEIDTMVPEEVMACLNTALIGLRERWPVVVGEVEGSDQLQPALRRRVESVGDVINALRLFKTGTISVPGTVAFREGMLESRGYQYGYSPASQTHGIRALPD
jgi:hypothetical protein